MPDSRLTIDLNALATNHATLRGVAGGAAVAPVVKADGYGLGAAAVARRLHAEGARTFYVARISEGEALRTALGKLPAEILVLDGAVADAVARLTAAALTPVLNSPEQVELWRVQGEGSAAALHVDTGMNRLGLTLEQAELVARGGLRLSWVMSHLACADEPANPMNARQLGAFRQARALFRDVRASLANSAGVFLGPDYAFDMVRPGISLYGGGPQGRPDPRLQVVATLEAPILQVRDVSPGETVGYGATFTAAEPLRVGILSAGYADGVLRAGSSRSFAALGGRRAPVIGRVSMDLIAVDVTGMDARPGDLAQMFGPDAPIDEVAAASDTLAYELLVRLAPRLQRRYIGA
ncbi:MAG: alanine racemase [Proteobacteria bacterium]|nr:alanine racemase [Pseudomonadota bacterium]